MTFQVKPLTRVVHVKRDPFDLYVGRRMPLRAFRNVGHLPASWRLRPPGWVVSPFGNPYRVGDDVDGVPVDLDGTIRAYARWIAGRPELSVVATRLSGLTLGCWCAPEGGVTAADTPYVCHGQVIAALADGLPFPFTIGEQCVPPTTTA